MIENGVNLYVMSAGTKRKRKDHDEWQQVSIYQDCVYYNETDHSSVVIKRNVPRKD